MFCSFSFESLYFDKIVNNFYKSNFLLIRVVKLVLPVNKVVKELSKRVMNTEVETNFVSLVKKLVFFVIFIF